MKGLIHFSIGFVVSLFLGIDFLMDELGKHRSYFKSAFIGGNLILASYIFLYMAIGEYYFYTHPNEKWKRSLTRDAFYFIALASITTSIFACINFSMFEAVNKKH